MPSPQRTRIQNEARESAKARRAWADYLDLGDGRTLQKLLDTYRDPTRTDPVPTKQISTLKDWSRWHGWQDRLAQIAAAAAAEAEAAERARWRERRARVRETEFELAEALAAKVRQMLQFPVQRVREERQGENGETIVNVIEPARWDFNTTARLLRDLSQVARLATEQPTAIQAAAGKITIREVVAEIPAEVAREYEAGLALDDDLEIIDSTEKE